MVDQLFFPNPVQPATSNQSILRKPSKTGENSSNSRFATLLDTKIPSAEGVRFSQHAQERLRARNITLSSQDLESLEGAVNTVAKKGGKESLVMMGDAALVVSIRNRTVVTAMDRSQMQGNVFTNIDSAVVI